MKEFLLLVLLISFSACSNDETKPLPRDADLEFKITSDDNDNSRESIISMALIKTTNDTVFNDTSGLGNNITFNKTYNDQSIDKGTVLNLTYVDFTIIPINGVYDPYKVALKIFVDNDEVKSETFLLENAGETVKTSFVFN